MEIELRNEYCHLFQIKKKIITNANAVILFCS